MGQFRNWLLSEQQQIKLELSKIKTYLLRGDLPGLSQYTYMCLRQNQKDHEAIMQSYGDQREAIFNAYASITSTAPAKGGSWAEWYPAGSNKLDARVPKLYFTPGDDRRSMAGFLNGFRDLFMSLGQVAKQHQALLGFKVPTDLWKFLEENDRLVVHLGLTPDPNQQTAFRTAVQQAVQQWAQQHNVQLHARTHSVGEDLGQRSFGVRLGDSFVKQFKDLVAQAGVDVSKPVDPQHADKLAQYYGNMVSTYLQRGDSAFIF